MACSRIKQNGETDETTTKGINKGQKKEKEKQIYYGGISNKNMNARGSILDLLYLMILLFVFAIGTLIAFTVWEEYKGATNSSSGINLSTSTFDHIQEKQDQVMQNFDYIFVFIIVGLTIALIASTFALKTHPIFFWISLLLLIIFLIIAGAFSNSYEVLTNNTNIAPADAEYDIMGFVMDRLPLFILIISMITLIALYAKSRFASEY